MVPGLILSPFGTLVRSVLIQNVSSFSSSCNVSPLSIGWTLRFEIEWSGLLKCWEIYIDFLLRILERWWFILVLSWFVVWPTYCFLHLLQVIR